MIGQKFVAASLLMMFACCTRAPPPPEAGPSTEVPGTEELAPPQPAPDEGYALDHEATKLSTDAGIKQLSASYYSKFKGFQHCAHERDCTLVHYGFKGCSILIASVAVARVKEFREKYSGSDGKCTQRMIGAPSASPTARCVDHPCTIEWSGEEFFHISDYGLGDTNASSATRCVCVI